MKESDTQMNSNTIARSLINTYVPRQKIYAEDIIYQKEVYLIYLKTSNDFKIAIKGRKLSREDVLHIKYMLNKALKRKGRKKYEYYTFKNDAHEIYTKLKSKCLTRRKLKKIDVFILSRP